MATFEEDLRLQVRVINEANAEVLRLKGKLAECERTRVVLEARLAAAIAHRDTRFYTLEERLFPAEPCPHCDGSL